MENIPRSSSDRTAKEIARQVAMKAGEILTDRFGRVNNVSLKSRGNIVTEVDTEVETEMLSILKTEYPGMGALGEESGGSKADKGYVWILDPLDGTRNYASGIPFYSTVVGLAKDGEPVLGINYDPVSNSMFEAEKGKGAFLNNKAIKVSERTVLADCVVGMDLSYQDDGAAAGLDVIRSIWPGMQTARIMGSSALGISYAAAGLVDIYFHHRLEPWDQVAGLLLVREAGGIITDRTGGHAGLYSDGLIASNPTLHAELMRITNEMAWGKPNQRPTP